MSAVINWAKTKIKSYEWTYSDLFLAIGFLFMVPFAALAWMFMVTWNPIHMDPSQIPFRPWMMIVCFSISAISWGIYFVLEIKKGHVKNNIFTWIYVLFAILSVVSVLIQPSEFTIDVECRLFGNITGKYFGNYQVGDIVTVNITIPWIHRMFFCFGSLLITTVFYILICVFPRRLKSLDILVFAGICIFIFLVVLATYSYIVEAWKYPKLIRAIFSKRYDFNENVEDIYGLGIASFIAHRVPYGVCMMLGAMFGLVLHGLTKKWYWSIPISFCCINMLFSYCKSAMAYTFITIFAYTVFELVRTLKNHKRRNIIALSSIGTVILVVAVLFLIAIISQGNHLNALYKIFYSYTNKHTLVTRTYIWRNVEKELSGGWWIIGRGFGTHNMILYIMNMVNNDPLCPSHSSYYAVLGAGGIFNLLGFVGSYIYFSYVFYKCFKVNKVTTIGLSLGFFSFLFYTITEGVNYLILFFEIPLIFYYYLIQNGYVKKEEVAQ